MAGIVVKAPDGVKRNPGSRGGVWQHRDPMSEDL